MTDIDQIERLTDIFIHAFKKRLRLRSFRWYDLPNRPDRDAVFHGIKAVLKEVHDLQKRPRQSDND